MSSLSRKDRVSLCSFTFSDGRQCRIPRSPGHSHLCSDHARKDSQARSVHELGRDLSYFFSGQYLSACDLSTALGSLLPAVVRGDVKPKTARTVAYLAQTLMQSIHLSKHEYINAFGTDGWRKAVRNSVNGNRDYRFPPAPASEKPDSPQPQPTAQPIESPVNLNCHSEPARLGGRSDERPTRRASTEPYREESAFSESPAARAQTTTPAPQPAPSPHAPPPPTGAEFAHVVAGLQTGAAPQPAPAQQSSLAPSPSTPPAPQTSPGKPEAPDDVLPNSTSRTSPRTPERALNRDAYALHFDHGYRLLIDGKPF